MKALLIEAYFFLSVIFNFTFAYGPWNFNGTTPRLETIMIGRCWEYQEVVRDNQKAGLTVSLDCNKVWNLFNKCFANKISCTPNYENLFKYINNRKNLTDQAMFWSGTRTVVHEFTNVNNDYETLEDTFQGYFANGLTWCGCLNCPGGINYNYCNSRCDQTRPYWELASRTFAENAACTAYVMVNGTTAPNLTAYERESFFGKTELPTLGKMKKVTKLIVYVVSSIDTTSKEKCGMGSLEQLVSDAHKVGISNVDCIDDPRMVNAILCAKYPSAQECQAKGSHAETNWKTASIVLIVVSVLLVMLVIILVFVLFRLRKAKRSDTHDYKKW